MVEILQVQILCEIPETDEMYRSKINGEDHIFHPMQKKIILLYSKKPQKIVLFGKAWRDMK